MAEGWIKLHRSIRSSDRWYRGVFSERDAWIDLLLQANHKPGKFFINQVLVEVGRGQLIGSIVKWGKSWKWSQGKTKRFLERLKIEEAIELKTESHYSTITILNYSKYQDVQKQDGEDSERQTESGRRGLGEDSETNKNVKKNKECKEEKNNTPLPPTFPAAIDSPESRAAWGNWLNYKSEIKKPYKSPQSQQAMLNRYEAYSPEQFIAAIKFSIGSGYMGIIDDPRFRQGTNGNHAKISKSAQFIDEARQFFRETISEKEHNETRGIDPISK